MISNRTKAQLMVFVLITLLGVSYVGARYAKLDRVIMDTTYEVVAHFTESGGIFAGAEVTYRGVTIGQVDELRLTEGGVDVVLAIEKKHDNIPADTKALVANRSAVGEQYVELQPYTNGEPFLANGSEIAPEDTETPIATSTMLLDLNELVNSVNKNSLRTVVSELGAAFQGTGEELGQIIDTSNSFIETANENFDLTTALIRDGNTVLRTQVESGSAIRSFSRDLALLTDTLVASDEDFRSVIDSGSATANELRSFLEENEVNLERLINNLITTGEITVARLDGLEQVLVLYPYVVEGGYTVVSKDPRTGRYDAHFGIITESNPHVCREGYGSTKQRPPQDLSPKPMNTEVICTEPPTRSNPRGGQHAPRPRAAADYEAPVIATYDPSTGTLEYTDRNPSASVTYTGGATDVFGEDSWQWLLLQPLAGEGK